MFIHVKKLALLPIISTLMLTMGLGGCQKHDEPANSISGESIEEAPPMTAEPAEADQTLVLDSTDNTAHEVEGLNTNDIQVSYNCTPALALTANYHLADNVVDLFINDQTSTLSLTNTGETPLVFENEQGLTQWRVVKGAQNEMASGTLRMTTDSQIQAYKCNTVL